MRLVVSEKNIAARRIAEILAVGKPKTDKVYSTPIYTFRRDGEDWVSIGLKGHILGVDFPTELGYADGKWSASWEDGRESAAGLPDSLPAPPWEKRTKPYLASGMDLRTWKLQSLPYLVWAPVGKAPAEKEIVRALKNLAKKADEIIIATDYDREGELIGADARGVMRETNKTVPVYRARFSAITKDEIERAFTELGEVSDELAAAGEARQDIDLVWGAVLTRYLTKVRFAGVGRPRSAGRVQTPTLKLIVDRELEREAFCPETYWTVDGKFSAHDAEFVAGHETERFTSGEAAQAVLDGVAGKTDATVADVTTTRRTVKPPTPFNTTALQAAASAEGIGPKRAMNIAESLYMNGYISYPRVDNSVYPKSLDIKGILKTLSTVPAYHQYADSLLKKDSLTATRGAKETTDHPPIHPTGAPDPEKLKPEEWKLYNLVARRFMATLSAPAVIEATKVGLNVASERFVARGDVIIEHGFRAIYHYGLKKDEHLPKMTEGDTIGFLGAESEQKETQPPKRYKAAGLIQEMEKQGLGTKATRHDIIETLASRGYTVNDPIEPTKLGRAVIEALSAFAERITTPGMTAELEAEMDDIANGRKLRENVVGHSRELLAEVMTVLLPRAEEVGDLLKDAAVEDAKVGLCPKSGHDLLVKSSPKTKGQFVGCAGWPDCDVTFPLPQGKIETVPEPCPECGTPQVKIIQFRQRPRVRCLDPVCPTNFEATVDIGACPTCTAEGKDGRLIAQRSPRTLKRFARCTNYETCNTSYPLPQNGELQATGEFCSCGAPMVVVHTGKGPWRICVDPACPLKAEKAAAAAKGGAKPKKAAAKKPAAKKAATKKPAAKKAAAKKPAASKKPKAKPSEE
ncbi:MAG: DNA topoisomerase [Actinobacteria bacterium HGW-Actinobacteria-6]|nr:MAG: DNA topoisomerase [Actinobacteria bacterium HGW-Actinobacteria-6]